MHRLLSQPDTCIVCDAPITRLEARQYGGTCSEYPCRSTHWQKTARQLQQQKQLQMRETARRRREQALAICKRLTAELMVAAPDRFVPVPLPCQQRPLRPLPASRQALFREHIERVVREACAVQTEPDAADAADAHEPDAMPDERQRALWSACGVCRGSCCSQGREHAFLDIAAIRRYCTRHPQATADEICRDYLMRLEDPTFEGSCVYHREHGCALPRHLRSDTCNGFECTDLIELRRTWHTSGDALFLVALEGDNAARWQVLDRAGPISEDP